MMVEFKRMVFGNRILVESQSNTNVIVAEIEAAYKLFRIRIAVTISARIS